MMPASLCSIGPASRPMLGFTLWNVKDMGDSYNAEELGELKRKNS